VGRSTSGGVTVGRQECIPGRRVDAVRAHAPTLIRPASWGRTRAVVIVGRWWWRSVKIAKVRVGQTCSIGTAGWTHKDPAVSPPVPRVVQGVLFLGREGSPVIVQ